MQARPSNPSVGIAEHSVKHRMVDQVSKLECSAATNNDSAARKSKRGTTFL